MQKREELMQVYAKENQALKEKIKCMEKLAARLKSDAQVSQ